MSGTNPDSVTSPVGSPSKGPPGNGEAAPKKGPAKHARAVTLEKPNDGHFGIDDPLKKGIDEYLTLSSDFAKGMKTDDSWKFSGTAGVKSFHDALCGMLSKGIELAETLDSLYYEGKTMHPYFIRKRTEIADSLSFQTSTSKDIREGLEQGFYQKNQGPKKATPTKEKGKQPEEKVEQNKPTFSEALIRSEEPKESKFSWADLVAEEIGNEARSKSTDTRQSLVAVIRSRAGISQENRVEIPDNLKTEMPHFFEKIQIAASLANCEIVENSRIKIDLAHGDVFGTDEKARNDVLATLYDNEGRPKKELLAIADLGVLIDTMLEIPSVDQIDMTGPGRVGTIHAASLLLRIFCEQKYVTPIAQQRNWWRGGPGLREELKTRIASQVGGNTVATCLMNCYDILYRKFIRRVLQTGEADKVDLLQKIADDLSKKLFNTGGALFKNLLRTETRKKKVAVEVVQNRRTQTKIEEQPYTAFIRPTIIDGPKTAFESSLYAKVNSALSRIEVNADDYHLGSHVYSSPIEWESKHQSWVNSLYQKTKLPSHLMVQRKKAIRAEIISRRADSKGEGTGAPPLESPDSQKINSAVWMTVQMSYINDNELSFDSASINALNDMLGTKHNKDGLLQMTESDITVALCR